MRASICQAHRLCQCDWHFRCFSLSGLSFLLSPYVSAMTRAEPLLLSYERDFEPIQRGNRVEATDSSFSYRLSINYRTRYNSSVADAAIHIKR
jgi:hypothetical protein